MWGVLFCEEGAPWVLDARKARGFSGGCPVEHQRETVIDTSLQSLNLVFYELKQRNFESQA